MCVVIILFTVRLSGRSLIKISVTHLNVMLNLSWTIKSVMATKISVSTVTQEVSFVIQITHNKAFSEHNHSLI